MSNENSGGALIDLRVALLRTIALVWEDDSKGGTLRRDLLAMSPEQVLVWFRKNLDGFTLVYQNFGVAFLAAVAEWNSFGDNTWTKHQGEEITITLPTIPKGANWNEFEKAEKLMEYYKYYYTFFGPEKTSDFEPDNTTDCKPDKATKITTDAVEKITFSEPSPSLPGNSYNLGDSIDSFESFSAVLIKLIAQLWDTPEEYKRIDYDQKPATMTDEEYYLQINDILSVYFQFNTVWKFGFKFLTPKLGDEYWLYNNRSEKWEWNPTPLIRNSVALEIPKSPLATDNVGLALARYNAIGPAYPFTCS